MTCDTEQWLEAGWLAGSRRMPPTSLHLVTLEAAQHLFHTSCSKLSQAALVPWEQPAAWLLLSAVELAVPEATWLFLSAAELSVTEAA